MKEILLQKSDEVYLEQCVAELEVDGLACGIVIGQKIDSEKFIVVHLARNREEDIDVRFSRENPSSSSLIKVDTVPVLKTLLNIDTQSVSNQWLSATKMMPGCFSVLGIFATTNEEKILDDEAFIIANKLLNDIRNLLMQSQWFDVAGHDFAFLAYSSLTKEARGKSYKYSTDGIYSDFMNCIFVAEPFNWYSFNCTYELDEVFPIITTAQKLDIQHQFKIAIEAVQQSLEMSQVLIHNEIVSDSLTMEEFVKNNSSVSNPQDKTGFNVSIFLPIKCQINDEAHAVKVRQFSGTIRLIGMISSRIYCNRYNTAADMKRYVRSDIIRSLATRVQVYCEGLTNTNISYEAIMISEPPRRVYFSLVGRGKGYPIQFSEYLFRNEITAMAATQANQVLDLNLDLDSITDDLEILPEDGTFSNFSSDIVSPDSPSLVEASRELNRTMYLLGITVSLLVLLLSACLHFFF